MKPKIAKVLDTGKRNATGEYCQLYPFMGLVVEMEDGSVWDFDPEEGYWSEDALETRGCDTADELFENNEEVKDLVEIPGAKRITTFEL